MSLSKTRVFGCAIAVAGALATAPAAASADDLTVNDNTAGPGPTGATCATADETTIQAAVTAANPGDRILVCAGTYNETVSVTKQLSILGAQAGNDARTRAITPANESTVTGAPSPAADGGFSVQASDVSINGFLVENAADPSTGGTGIQLPGSTGDHRVVNNVVRNNTIGLYLSNNSGVTDVRHNLFDSNNEAGAAAGNGIYGDAEIEDVRVDENLFTGNDNSAMTLTETDDVSENVEFTGNEVTENRGVSLFLANDVLVEGNTIEDTDSGDGNGAFSAIYLGGGVDGAVIRDNDVSLASTAVRIDNGFFPSETNANVEVTGNSLTANDNGIRITDTALSGDLEAHFNRITGNAVAGVNNEEQSDSVDAENNWWGCNEGPTGTDCDSTVGDVDFDPWLVLAATAKRPQIKQGRSTKVIASVQGNSDGATFTNSQFPDGTAIGFATTKGAVDPASAPTVEGLATTTFNGTERGNATITATLDQESATTKVKVKRKKKN